MKYTEIEHFCADTNALRAWRQNLERQDAIESGTEIFNALKTLKPLIETSSIQDFQPFIDELTLSVLHVTPRLEALYAINPKQRKLNQLNVSLLTQQAKLLLQCAETHEDSPKALRLNQALHLLSIGHYQTVLSYSRPSHALWLAMGRIYHIGHKSNLLQAQVNADPAQPNPLNTLEKTLKRILLFTVSHAYRLRPSEIKALFEYCAELSQHVELYKLGTVNREGFCWLYKQGQLPYPIYQPVRLADALTFNTDPLVSQHKMMRLNWPLQNPNRILQALNNYKEIASSSAMVLPNHHVFVSGTDKVSMLLHKHLRNERVWPVNSPTPAQLNFSSLELYQDKPVSQKEKVGREDIWGSSHKEKEKLDFDEFGALKTYKTNAPGYFVNESIKAKLQDQDLLVLYGSDLIPQLAIVRRLEPSKTPLIEKGLLQLLPGRASAVVLLEAPSKIAVLLRQQELLQLFLPPEKYTTGASLNTSSGLLSWSRLIETTPYFMRYQVEMLA